MKLKRMPKNSDQYMIVKTLKQIVALTILRQVLCVKIRVHVTQMKTCCTVSNSVVRTQPIVGWLVIKTLIMTFSPFMTSNGRVQMTNLQV